MTQSTTRSTSHSASVPLPPPRERRRLREAKSLTVKQLASAVGVTQSTVRAWETGRYDPRGRKGEQYVRLLAAYAAEVAAAEAAEDAVAAARGTHPAGGRREAPRGRTGASPDRPTGAVRPAAGPAGHPTGGTKAPDVPPSGVTAEPHVAPSEGTAEPAGGRPDGPADRSAGDRAEDGGGARDAGTARKRTPEKPAAGSGRGARAARGTAGRQAEEPRRAALCAAGAAGSPGTGRRTRRARSRRAADGAPPGARPAAADAPAGLAPVSAGAAAPASAPGSGDTAATLEPSLTPEQAFDALYAYAAPGLVRQTYLLTGQRALARESVERAFQQAWQRWPEVAVDRDPAGWVRAAAHEYAISPWHRLRYPRPAPPVPAPAGSALHSALLDLPPAYRRSLLLYDGLGLDLPDTAAETEASTPAAGHRVLHAREAIAERLPEFTDAGLLHTRLGELARTVPVPEAPPPPAAVRSGCERRARLWARAAIVFTALIVGLTVLTLVIAPTEYHSPEAPPEPVGGVPAAAGPQRLDKEDVTLRDALRARPDNGPQRLVPAVG